MPTAFDKLSADSQWRIDQVCREFEESRYDESPPPLSSFVSRVSSEEREVTLRELLAIDFELLQANQQDIPLHRYHTEWPDATRLIEEVFTEVAGVVAPLSSPPPSAKFSESSARRLGAYRLVREIGQGGMGLVYEAIDEFLHRRVALKMLRPHLWFGNSGEQRFQREARAIARLHHSHIVDVYGNGEQDGIFYFAMQLIDGASLDLLVQQGTEKEWKMRDSLRSVSRDAL